MSDGRSAGTAEDDAPPGPSGSGSPGDAPAGLWPRVRSALGRLRRWPERALHPWRRRTARRRLREASPPARVLVVCHGNICRSPYAEGALRRRTGGRVGTDSAGFFGPDRSPPPEARQVADERGVDLSDHRSKLVDGRTLARTDLVVVMEPGQARAIARDHGVDDALVLGDLDPQPVERRAVRDPVMQPAEVFRDVYGRIDRCLDALVEAAGLPRARRKDQSAAADDGSADGESADGGSDHQPLRSRLGADGPRAEAAARDGTGEVRPNSRMPAPGDGS